MRFKLTGPPPRSRENPDNYLPIAQTCFFSLSVPEYSTEEVRLILFHFMTYMMFFDQAVFVIVLQICYQKLKYAVSNTQLMDADFAMRNAEGWQNIT